MNSKEALREIVTSTLKYLPNNVIDKISKLSNIVLQDLEIKEQLEKENQELKELLESSKQGLHYLRQEYELLKEVEDNGKNK